jgi:hypothetical protein
MADETAEESARTGRHGRRGATIKSRQASFDRKESRNGRRNGEEFRNREEGGGEAQATETPDSLRKRSGAERGVE